MSVKQLLNYIPVVLGVIIVTGAILMTGGFAPSNSWGEEGDLFADTQPETAPATTSSALPQVPALNTTGEALLLSRKSFTTTSSTTDTSTTTPTSSSSTITTTTTTTTTKLTAERLPGGVYSSIRIFLDIQRIVFYKTDSAGNEYPVTAVYCSTGKASTPTRATGEEKPHKLTGRKLTQAKFSNPSKYAGACTVRYAVEIKNPVWFHSEPYIYQGEGKLVNKATCDMAGYRALGRTVSSGCIRLCLRDAKFLYNIARPDMNCYILSSSKGYSIPSTRPIPAANPGSRNWDPTDPEWSGYVSQPTEEEPAPTTIPTTVAPTTTTTTEAATTVSQKPTTKQTTTAPTTTAPSTDPASSTDPSSSSSSTASDDEPPDDPVGY